MKRDQIKTGKVYSDGRGRFSIVTGEGDYPLFPGQTDHDCIEYETVRVSKRGPVAVEHHHNSYRTPYTHHTTRSSFATWAAREATDEEATMVRRTLEIARFGGES